MNLELKQIIPYLEFGLQAEMIDYKSDYVGKQYDEIIGIHQWSKNGDWCLLTSGGSKPDLNKIKPILIPLSEFGDSDDIRKVAEFIGIEKWCEHYDFYFSCWFNDLSNIQKLVLQAPYEIFQYFLANHYDVFSLIPNGLAIDKNTLPCNQ